MELLEKILDDKNLFNAYKQVYKNKGTSGVDNISVEQLENYMAQHKEEIKEQIRNLKYKPSPVRRVEIPKENGKTAQIDLIMINNYGIYIIESKNISGTIYGSEDDKYWTIVYANGQKNITYYNPVLQNKVHTNAVIKLFPNIYG